MRKEMGERGNTTGREAAEGALKESEGRFRSLADASFEGIAISEGGKILEANRAFAEMFGYEPSEVAGMDALRFHAPGARDAVRWRMSSGSEEPYESVGLKKDGTTFDVEVRGKTASHDGRAVRVAAIRDVTERRRAEHALRESEMRFRQLFEQSVDALFVHDEEGRFVDCNRQATRLLGYSREELLELSVRDVSPDALSAEEKAKKEKGGGTLWQRAMAGEPGIFAVGHEERNRRKDGTTFPIEVRVGPIDYGGRRMILAATRDITARKRTEESLRESEERFRSAFESASTGMALVGLDNRYLRANRALCEMLGYPRGELLGKTSFEITHPEDLEMSRGRTRRMLEEGGPPTQSLEKRYLKKDGGVVWAISDVSLVRDSGGEPSHFVAQFQDIGRRKEAERGLKESEGRHRRRAREQALLHRVRDAYARELELPEVIRAVVEAVAEAYGYALVSVCLLEGGAEDGELVLQHQVGYETVIERIPVSEGVSGRVVRTGKSALIPDVREDPAFLEAMEGVVSEVCVPLFDEGEVVGMLNVESTGGHTLGEADLGLLETVAEHVGMAVGRARLYARAREAERRLSHQALHDPLTGLPNRRLLLDRLSHALDRAGRRRGKGASVAVLFVDLDGFKVVNDSLGHEAGDELLEAATSRLGGVLRPSDTLSRLGGDEFVVLLEDEASAAATRVAERILGCMEGPFVVAGRDVSVGASVGIAFHEGGAGAKRPADLLREADMAMYRAKESGKGSYALFEPGMQERATERLELEGDLRRAMDGGCGNFFLLYQPIVRLGSGEISGMEALLRWRHPEKGTVMPERFVPVAEATGLIGPLGRWALGEAARRAKEWRGLLPPASVPVVCVNLSAGQFRRPNVVEEVRSLLRENGLKGGALGLEITEGAVMEEAPATVAKLEELNGLGVTLAIDDFGTGYSSLSYLRRFPVDSLKIDRSFVCGLGGEDGPEEVVASGIVGLARGLGLEAVAEGVETEGQLSRLEAMGCGLAQGNLFSEPLGARAASALLESGARLGERATGG